MRMSPHDYFSYPDNRRITSLETRLDAEENEGVEHEGWYTDDFGIGDNHDVSDDEN